MNWEIIFLLIFAGLACLLDRDIDPYPPPYPRSAHPRRVLGMVLFLWFIAVGMNALRLLWIEPRLENAKIDQTVRELIDLPILTLTFFTLPAYSNHKSDRNPPREMGLTLENRSVGVTIFALAFGLISGAVAFWSGETVVGVSKFSSGALLLLIYNNAFIEEFFYRGFIQTNLERVVGQRAAVLVSGLLYAATHVFLDLRLLADGWTAVLYALSMQTLGGWLLGLIFVKTRTLWPAVACHYLVNWLPSLLSIWVG